MTEDTQQVVESWININFGTIFEEEDKPHILVTRNEIRALAAQVAQAAEKAREEEIRDAKRIAYKAGYRDGRQFQGEYDADNLVDPSADTL